MGFSLLLLWVWMKSPCCSAIRTGHSPVNLSQWAIHDFLYAMSNCYKHILSNYHSQSHLQMHIQSQIIWIIVFHWSISKHLRQYLDSFEWWKALPLGNVLDLFSLCILRCVLLTMALRVKSLVLVASWFKGDAPMGAWAEGVYSIGISRNSCFTSN